MKNSRLAKFYENIQGFLVPVALLAVWQWLSSQAIINPQILPAPTAVLFKWWEYLLPYEAYDPAKASYFAWIFSGELIHDAYASLYRVVVICTCSSVMS